MIEPELGIIRRAFPEAQRLLAGAPLAGAVEIETGWHDTTADPETGAAAVVDLSGVHEDLIGEVIRVTVDGRSAFVYVVGRADVPTPLSLARRAFLAVSPLAEESVTASVEVV